MAIAVGAALGSWRGGLAIATGLLIGAANGFLTRRALRSETSFRVTSVGRLAILTAAGVALSAPLGWQAVPLTLFAIGAAQVVLVLVAGITLVRA